jgi:hypothetical protein
MTHIRFNCDRCGAPVEGIHTHFATAGFYVVDGDSPWARFARPKRADGPGHEEWGGEHEHFVCKECIWSMPEYQAEYGTRASEASPHAGTGEAEAR